MSFKYVEYITEPEQLADGRMILLLASHNGGLFPHYCRSENLGAAVQELLAHYRDKPAVRRVVEPVVLSFTGPALHTMPPVASGCGVLVEAT